MGIIRQLSETTINRIAAGEVVDRPASVVKELIENALDAEADKIEIILEQGGKNLMSVTDNGHGISRDDLFLAVQRHTTSKLDENDIMNISSFGFRGEALPSIGSVARMNIVSKTKDSHVAFTISVEGGMISDVTTSALTEGTRVTIRDLFFATPARLKFLRSDRSELSACTDIVKKIAMANPHCAFTLTHNDRVILKLRACSELHERVVDLLDEDFVRNSVNLSTQREEVEVVGLVSLPTYNRSTSEDQYLFINNRPVKDKLLASALKVAYQDFLARDRFPVAVMFINTNPYFVDVNVHPAKTEVRFRDSSLMRGMLISAIKDALGGASHRVSDTVSIETLSSFTPAKSQHISYFSEPAQERYIPGNYIKSPSPSYRTQETISPLFHIMPNMKTEEQNETFEEQKNFPLGAASAQLHETYIISQTKDSIIITDQHAAHERLTYEKLKVQGKNVIKQRLLMPEIVDLPDEKRADALEHKKKELATLGLSFERFGEKSVVIEEIPSLIGDINIDQLIQDMADNLIELGEDAALSKVIEHVLETYACHHSIRAGKKLSIHEMNQLLRDMENTPFSGQCNHGRPTYITLKLKDIEKLFGRS